MNKHLKRAIKLAGGGSALAALLKIRPQAISQWDKCPIQRVLAVEKASGGKVSRHQLRPDIYGKAAPKLPDTDISLLKPQAY